MDALERAFLEEYPHGEVRRESDEPESEAFTLLYEKYSAARRLVKAKTPNWSTARNSSQADTPQIRPGGASRRVSSFHQRAGAEASPAKDGG